MMSWVFIPNDAAANIFCPTMTDGCSSLDGVILGVQCPLTPVSQVLNGLWSPSGVIHHRPVSCDTLINNNTVRPLLDTIQSVLQIL